MIKAIFSAADSMDRWRLVVVTFVDVQASKVLFVLLMVDFICSFQFFKIQKPFLRYSITVAVREYSTVIQH